MALYSNSNTININSVDGSTFVGRYSAEGYWNGVDQSSNTSTYVGFIHKSGAINYVIDNGSTPHGLYHPNGAMYVTDNGTLNGGISVTVIGAGGGATSAAALLLASETNGLALDFTDTFWQATTGFYGSAKIKDLSTPANDYDSSPVKAASSLLTYSYPSPKMCMGPTGTLRYGAHNLCLQSDAIDTSPWTTSGGTATSASQFLESVANTHHAMRQLFTAVSGVGYACAFKIKPNGRQWHGFYAGWAGKFAWFDLQNGVVGTVEAGITATIGAVDAGGYYPVVVSGLSTATGAEIDIYTRSADNSTATFAGDITKGFNLKNVQVYRTPADTTYLATTSSARYALPYEWSSGGALQGILVEEQRTNKALYSNTFSNAVWTKSALTVAQDATGPDGVANSAWTLTAIAGAANHSVYQNTTVTTNCCNSFIVKAGTASWCAIAFDGSSNTEGAFFNLATGTVGTVRASTTASITSLGNGWYLCTAVKAGMSYCNLEIHTSDAQAAIWSAAGTETIIVCNAQLEGGTFPTSRITTAGATVTRAADNISLVTSAFPYLQATSTVYASYVFAGATPSAPYPIGLDNGSGLSVFAGIRQNTTQFNTDAGSILISPALSSTTNKVAFAQASADRAVAANGNTANTSSAAYTPGLATTLSIGLLGNTPSAYGMCGYIKQIMYLPRRMSNADIKTLTT